MEKVFQCTNCVSKTCHITIDGGNPKKPIFCVYDWGGSQRKALWKNINGDKPEQDGQFYDISYFDNPNCPKWINYIAIDEDGEVWGYSDKPNIVNDKFISIDSDNSYFKKLGLYSMKDKSDWKNSLIERPKEKAEDNNKPKQNGHFYDVSYFDNPECPKWANYIAMDKDGSIWIFNYKPEIVGDRFVTSSNANVISMLKRVGTYGTNSMPDNSNWKNSIIERPKEKVTYFTINVNNKFN